MSTGYLWDGNGGGTVPTGTLGEDDDWWAQRYVCPHCGCGIQAPCTPKGEHLARYGLAWQWGMLSREKLLQACWAAGTWA